MIRIFREFLCFSIVSYHHKWNEAILKSNVQVETWIQLYEMTWPKKFRKIEENIWHFKNCKQVPSQPPKLKFSTAVLEKWKKKSTIKLSAEQSPIWLDLVVFIWKKGFIMKFFFSWKKLFLQRKLHLISEIYCYTKNICVTSKKWIFLKYIFILQKNFFWS